MRDIVTDFLDCACEAADSIIEISEYASIFEAAEGNEKVMNIEKSNNASVQKSKNLVLRAVDAIKAAISKIRAALSEFKARLSLKGSEKEEFDRFCKEVKNNPEFANKKVTVTDWKKMKNSYDSIMKEIEHEIEVSKRTEEECKPNILKALEEKVAGFGKGAKNMAITITMGQLIARSKYDRNFAELLETSLDLTDGAVNQITKDMDEKDVKKFKRKIRWNASTCKLRRLQVYMQSRRLTIEEQAQKEIKEQTKAFRNSIIKGSKYVGGKKEALKLGADIISQTGKEVWRDQRNVNAKKRELKRMDKLEAKSKKARKSDWFEDNREGIDKEKERLKNERKEARAQAKAERKAKKRAVENED